MRDAVELLAGERQALMVIETAGRSASSRAPTCSSRWPDEPRLPAGARFATRAVHAGLDPDPYTGGVVPAIHQATTYVQRAPGEFVEDYDYSRSANPTRAALERALGELEGGLGVAFASGMAAEHALITARVQRGRSRRPARRPLRRHLPARRQGPGPLGPRLHAWSTSATSTPSRRP